MGKSLSNMCEALTTPKNLVENVLGPLPLQNSHDNAKNSTSNAYEWIPVKPYLQMQQESWTCPVGIAVLSMCQVFQCGSIKRRLKRRSGHESPSFIKGIKYPHKRLNRGVVCPFCPPAFLPVITLLVLVS